MSVLMINSSRLAVSLVAVLLSASIVGPSLHSEEVAANEEGKGEKKAPRVRAPADITDDEPFAKVFSLEKAADYLDHSSLHWQQSRKCGTCHTNIAYMMARPALTPLRPQSDDVRKFFESMVTERWEDKEKGPRWDAEVVCVAATLAINDAATSGQLHETTRRALDRMFDLQREDGGWDWLICGWPPMEYDDHFGATLAAVGIGAAPGDFAATEKAKKSLAGIRRYLQANPPVSMQHRLMVMWASLEVDGLMGEVERQALLGDVMGQQKADGGWNTATLLPKEHKRKDDVAQDFDSSDGYATGFVVYLARRAGMPASDPRLARGILWLATNQRETGRWYTASPTKDSKHLLSNYGTAFAVLALAESGLVKPSASGAAEPSTAASQNGAEGAEGKGAGAD